MINALILVFWSFIPLAVYTSCGHAVSNQFEMFYQEVCQCNWYFFPVELQHILMIVVLNTQKPTIIRGLGNACCTREAFKKVGELILFCFVRNDQIALEWVEQHTLSLSFSCSQTINIGFSYFMTLHRIGQYIQHD